MFKSLKLGKLAGIELFVHPTFWILPLFVFLNTFRYGPVEIVFNLLFVFAVFACVVLHELGHALAARGYGIGTRHITLYPIGGVAALDRLPAQPAREIAIALAGPAVNLVIATVLALLLVAGGAELTADSSTNDMVDFFGVTLLRANIFLCLFNLLPAFPMDGGRVFRALLEFRLNKVRATEVATRVGTVVAIGLGLYGLFVGQFFMVFLAITVFMLGQAELAMVRMRERGRWARERLDEHFRPADDLYEEVPATSGDRPPSPRFSGLAWDAATGGWVEWRNGVPVKPLPHGR
jgi:Zn-dependent protease